MFAVLRFEVTLDDRTYFAYHRGQLKVRGLARTTRSDIHYAVGCKLTAPSKHYSQRCSEIPWITKVCTAKVISITDISFVADVAHPQHKLKVATRYPSPCIQ